MDTYSGFSSLLVQLRIYIYDGLVSNLVSLDFWFAGNIHGLLPIKIVPTCCPKAIHNYLGYLTRTWIHVLGPIWILEKSISCGLHFLLRINLGFSTAWDTPKLIQKKNCANFCKGLMHKCGPMHKCNYHNCASIPGNHNCYLKLPAHIIKS